VTYGLERSDRQRSPRRSGRCSEIRPPGRGRRRGQPRQHGSCDVNGSALSGSGHVIAWRSAGGGFWCHAMVITNYFALGYEFILLTFRYSLLYR
jgi:hypothetical protein